MNFHPNSSCTYTVLFASDCLVYAFENVLFMFLYKIVTLMSHNPLKRLNNINKYIIFYTTWDYIEIRCVEFLYVLII